MRFLNGEYFTGTEEPDQVGNTDGHGRQLSGKICQCAYHINVIGPEGLYVNPLGLLAAICDSTPPTLEATWWTRRDGERLLEFPPEDESATFPVVDALDIAPGDLGAQSVRAIAASQDSNRLFSFDLTVLPELSFLDGVSNVYFLGEIELLEGRILRSKIRETRRFRYAIPLGDSAETVELTLRDSSGNVAKKSITPNCFGTGLCAKIMCA